MLGFWLMLFAIKFIDHFQRYLNDPASALIAIEGTTFIMKEEHKTKINISIGMI